MRAKTSLVLILMAASTLAACEGGEEPKPVEPAAPVKEEPPAPVQEALVGGPFPAVVLSQAWFWKGSDNKPVTMPARLEIWRKTGEGWNRTRLEDPDSNVFHKALFYDGGLLTIGAEKALLKRWTFADGAWKQETLLERDFGGKFDRFRDLEIGDVDGDGKDEFVLATHDAGVVMVYNPDDPTNVVELDRTPDTFVHEIEIGDIDGDGKKEFFATPTGRNSSQGSQAGAFVMYRWDGTTYQRTVVEQYGGTHAKEILVSDITGDGKAEIFAVLEAEASKDKGVTQPVVIRQYTQDKKGAFVGADIATIDDRQTRFLVPADLDQDGKIDLVASAMKSGIWLLKNEGGTWTSTNIDANSSGFEHATFVTDLDGDGKPEMYVAADDQAELKEYVYNPETKAIEGKLIGKLARSTFTWNLAAGSL